MTTATTKKPMTAEEFCDWVHLPENTDRWFELVRGEVIELPPPMKPHGAVCMKVGYFLTAYVFQRGHGYTTCNDSGVILERDPDTVRGPDVALYEDAQRFADLHPKYGEVPPRLAVEVVSPNDRATNLLQKIDDYLEAGVGMVWVIEPERRKVSVYRPDGRHAVFTEGQELTGDEVLPDFRCPVAAFFLVNEEPAESPG